jgi:hypothetical protein
MCIVSDGLVGVWYNSFFIIQQMEDMSLLWQKKVKITHSEFDFSVLEILFLLIMKV